VEVVRFTGPLPGGDHVDGLATRRPHVVVVDARGHDGDEHFTRAGPRDRQHLRLEGVARQAEAVLADHLGHHCRWYLPERRKFTNLDGLILRHSVPPRPLTFRWWRKRLATVLGC
jgi:hypothetical protein